MTDEQQEQRENAIIRSFGVCKICGKPLQAGAGQFAHKIPNKEMYRKKYGTFIIDHTVNGEYTCSLGCNASVDVGSSYGNHLDVIADILIYEYERLWGIDGLGKLADKLTEKYKKIYRGVK